MGTNIRTRLSGRHSDAVGTVLSERDVESALGRLAAYADDRPEDRRRPPSSTPALRRRAGLWKR
jgi:hypothetical protein